MSKGAFPTQSYLGNFGNYNLPPMAFTNRFMPPKPNYQPLMKMPTQPDPRAGFMSIQQQPAPYIQPTPVQPAPQLPPIEPMVTPTQPLTTTPQPLAQAPSFTPTLDSNDLKNQYYYKAIPEQGPRAVLNQAPSLLDVPDRIERPRDRFMSINRRGLPPINLFR